MAGCERKVQEWSNGSVQEAECLRWSSVDSEILKKMAVMPGKEWTGQTK